MSKRTGRLLAGTLAAGLVLSMGSAALAAPVGMVKQFKVPTARSDPRGITSGSDGNRWFTEGTDTTSAPPKIAQITPSGKITEFLANCSSCSSLSDIVQGSDGIFYMTSNDAHLVRFNPAGAGTFLDPLQIPDAEDPARGAGSADNMAVHGDEIWFVTDFNSLTRYNVATDQFRGYPFQPGTNVSDVAVDGAGSPWFTDADNHTVNRLNPVTGEVAASDSFDTGALTPRAITIATPDGQIWFTSQVPVEGVARLNPSTGVVTPFVTTDARPQDIAAGSGGAIWFTQNQKGNIARIDNTGIESGVITETKVVKGNDPSMIVVAPNGDPWYTMTVANKIGAFVLR